MENKSTQRYKAACTNQFRDGFLDSRMKIINDELPMIWALLFSILLSMTVYIDIVCVCLSCSYWECRNRKSGMISLKLMNEIRCEYDFIGCHSMQMINSNANAFDNKCIPYFKFNFIYVRKELKSLDGF